MIENSCYDDGNWEDGVVVAQATGVTKIIGFQKKGKKLRGRKKIDSDNFEFFFLNISLSFEEKISWCLYVQKAAKEKFVKFLTLA